MVPSHQILEAAGLIPGWGTTKEDFAEGSNGKPPLLIAYLESP